jgi:hypothetical protein
VRVAVPRYLPANALMSEASSVAAEETEADVKRATAPATAKMPTLFVFMM